jgi:type IV secretory pathway VirB2 component (pilin)
MAKAMMHGGHRATLVISGILLIIIGVMWWMGRLSLDKALAALLILWGLKKLYWASQGECC